MKEGLLTFSSQQALAGTSNVISTNVFDAATAKKLFRGFGEPFKLWVVVTASGGTTPTFQARLVGADDAALTSNVVDIWNSGTSKVLAAADIPWVYEQAIVNQLTAKEFYGMIYLQTGTSPTATVNALMGPAHQSQLIR